jgi:predicted XRE-type DNA-binding protein
MARKTTTLDYVKSSGNVFADLGLPHPERALLKAALALEIVRITKARHLTELQASEIIGITRPHAALLLHNRSVQFSVERLMDFLIALGRDVEIRVKRTRKTHGQIAVVVAA